MRALVFTLAILLTASGCPQETPQKPQKTRKCTEDMACWNCKTMGNRKCGHPPKDRKSTPPKPRRTVDHA